MCRRRSLAAALVGVAVLLAGFALIDHRTTTTLWLEAKAAGISSCELEESQYNVPPKLIDDIVVGVVTSGPRQASYFPAINQTWARDFKHFYFFTNYSTPVDLKLNVRFVSTDAKYVRNSWEFIQAHRLLFLMHPNAKFYYICGDDAWVHGPRLAKFASMLDSRKLLYYGRPVRRGPGNFNYCQGGCGYLISNALMCAIQPSIGQDFALESQRVSDRETGVQVNRSGSYCKHGPGFYGFSLYRTLHNGGPLMSDEDGVVSSLRSFEPLKSAIAFHYVKPKDQYLLHYFFRRHWNARREDNLDWNGVDMKVLRGDLILQ